MQAWQATVQDDRGNAVPNPVVSVYNSAGSLAQIYSEAGAPLPNPLTGTLDGFVQFWAEPGVYRIDNGAEDWFVELGALDVADSLLVLGSYEEAVEAAQDPARKRVEAIVDNRLTAWIPKPGGGALDGGWSPADQSTPQHYDMAAGSVGSALSRALNVAGDRVVDLGTGTYILDGETVEALHPFTLRGNGPGKTTLICRNMSGRNAINVTLSGPYNGGTSRIEGMSIILEGGNGGTFLKTPQGAAARTFLAKYEIENVRFHGPQMPGTAAVGFAWETALQLGDGDHHIVRNCEYYGRYDPRYAPTAENAFGAFLMLGGIAGEGGLGYPVIDDCRILYAGLAVGFPGGLVARPKFNKMTVHDCWRGIYSDLPLGRLEELTLVDCDLNTQNKSLHIEAIGQLTAVATDATRAPGLFDHSQGWTGWYVGGGNTVSLSQTRAYDPTPSTTPAYSGTHVGYDIGADVINLQGRLVTATNGRFSTGVRLRSPRMAQVDLDVRATGAVTTAVSVEGTAPTGASVSVRNLKAPANVTNRLSTSGGYSRTNVRDVDAPVLVDASTTAISAAGSETYIPGVSPVWRRIAFSAGSGPYTYDITMSATGARQGDQVDFTVTFTAANATFRILDNSGAVQYSKTGSAGQVYSIQGRYLGTTPALFRVSSYVLNT